jgi:hypothetical protein
LETGAEEEDCMAQESVESLSELGILLGLLASKIYKTASICMSVFPHLMESRNTGRIFVTFGIGQFLKFADTFQIWSKSYSNRHVTRRPSRFSTRESD